MSDAIDLERLRWKMSNVLHSRACQKIRFKLDNVAIQTFMYAYIGDAITNRLVHVDPDSSGRGYDYRTDVITLDSYNPPPHVIVHEATHAVIDATHKGKTISVGTHEAAAYLAETMYSMYIGDDDASSDVPHLDRPLMLLARRVISFNASHSSGLFVCPYSDTLDIKRILGSSALRSDTTRDDTMNGIGSNGRGY